MRRLLLLAFIWGWSFPFIKVSVEGLTPPTVACAPSALGALVLVLPLPFAVATSGTSGLELSVRRALAIGALGAIGTGVAYLLNYRIVADVGATRASVVTYIIPVVAVTVGVVVLGEKFEWRVVWG